MRWLSPQSGLIRRRRNMRVGGAAGGGAAFTFSITGFDTDSLGNYAEVGAHAGIGISITPDALIWSNENPAGPDKSGAATTYGTGSSPTAFTSGTLYAHARVGTDWVTRSLPIRYAPGSLGAFSNQTFTEGVGGTYQHPAATGTGLTWTYAQVGAVAGVTYNPANRTFTYADTLAIQAGTSFGASATDQYGRAATGSPRTATFTIQEDLSVNPSLTLGTQTPGSGGSPDSVAVTAYSYAGEDAVDLYVVTTSTATPQSQANIIAGSGGAIIEGDSQLGYTGGQIDLDFTINSGVTHIQAVAVERVNGGTSGVQVVAVVAVDFTAPEFVSAEATDANTVVATFDENLLGTEDASDWAFDIDGSPATITAVDITDDTVTLTVSDTMTDSDVLDEFAYTPGDITNVRGNALAAFSGEAITNNVPVSFEFTQLGDQTLGGSASTTKTLTSAVDSQPFDRMVFFWLFDESNSTESIDVTIAGVTATKMVERLSDSLATIRGYYAEVPSGVSGNIVLTKATNIFQFASAFWGWTPTCTVEAAVATGSSAQNATYDVSQTVADGSFVWVASAHRGVAGTITWPGTVTILKNYTFAAGRATLGIVPVTTAGTLTLTCVEASETETRRADACSIEVIPD